MTDTEVITALSSLPVELINDIRIAAAIARNANPGAPKLNKRNDKLIHFCNEALEAKQ